MVQGRTFTHMKVTVRRARVDVVFTDTKGRRWLVYDWAIIAGIRYRRESGGGHCDYRGFLLRATGEKRIYTFTSDTEPRTLSPAVLLKQLRASKPWRKVGGTRPCMN